MSTDRFIIEVRHSAEAEVAAMMAMDTSQATTPPDLALGVALDPTFPPVQIPHITLRHAMEAHHEFGVKIDFDMAPEASTYIVRAAMEEAEAEAMAERDDVEGVFADVAIQPMPICPGSPPLGGHADVEKLLCAAKLHALGADGAGVSVAIVDTGVNMAFLNSRGKHPAFDAARSWAPRPGLTPGSMPTGHGTMCAFDVCIAAPRCTILDIALLASNAPGGTVMEGLLSDAVRAYSHLLMLMESMKRPGENASLVVNNSWGMFHPSWDYPVGHRFNYSDNPNHPFNRIVATLERAGADILFAAGNCGSNCADGRCQGVTSNAIYGANSHASVLCVAGVDTAKQRVGYSTQGPGRLMQDKPDLCGYTHFTGSGVYAADGGTSAATPVVAGLVAAIRTKRPFQTGNASVSPTAIRDLLRSTAQDLGAAGYDFDHGFGVVNGCAIADRLKRFVMPIDICQRIPGLCDRVVPVPIDFCRRFPKVCELIKVRKWPPEIIDPLRDPIRGRPAPGLGAEGEIAMLDLVADPDLLQALDIGELAALFYYLGQNAAPVGTDSATKTIPAGSGDCNCSKG